MDARVKPGHDEERLLQHNTNWPGSCIVLLMRIGSTFMQMDVFLVWVALLSAVSMLALSKTD
jgi:hypothetical protein